jgi:hypothetical protein
MKERPGIDRAVLSGGYGMTTQMFAVTLNSNQIKSIPLTHKQKVALEFIAGISGVMLSAQQTPAPVQELIDMGLVQSIRSVGTNAQGFLMFSEFALTGAGRIASTLRRD